MENVNKIPDIAFDAEAIAAGIPEACGLCGEEAEEVEAVCREYLVPAMNTAYQRGKANAAECINIVKLKADGPLNDHNKRHLIGILDILNAAYAKGQRAAIAEVGRG